VKGMACAGPGTGKESTGLGVEIHEVGTEAAGEDAPCPSITSHWDVKEAKMVLDDYISNAGKEVQKLGTPF
jgi:hypothetical protein